ncbi:hypothetical protein F9Y90_01610 [Borrelia miyamotoi]|uniref:Membrane associated protein n=1 Tax=Borrelia miyamotoi TaxID=47466 RepID=A0AAX3JLM8_9SPIR|nr:hypothetical protein [Borrelia miyamotoi]QFP41822.1 hypothetical protein F9Y90_01610 [Borrelia miyamotoi]QFP47942.1 hypothetical protein F9Y91_01605 [Borrelia miyamotoi]QGT55701.1 hypothetical protein GNY89_01615 [Borrelia miyamotoi]QGT56483.1 hypothetical protein GNY88_01615 [Borrelia miyamotoi]WAZ71731.1 hypothetical protein O5404_01620 [Borrelia miyamotoi]
MNEQYYEVIFLLSFSIFLSINLFNFKREFSYEDYFIIFPGIFFIITLYLTEIRPLMFYVGTIFLFFLITTAIKTIKTIILRRRQYSKDNKIKRIVLNIPFKIMIVLPSIMTVLIATVFSYLGLFINYPEDINPSYRVGFTKIKDQKNNLNLSVWYPINLTIGFKRQNPFLFYKFNPFFINEMNYLPLYENVYKDAPISNNKKLYDTILIILPFYSHDSMFKSFVNRLVKKGNIVYLYTPKYKHINTNNFIKNDNAGLLTYTLNATIKYLIEPIKIFSDRKDITSEVSEIQNVLEIIKSTQKLKFLGLRMNLNKLILITMGNQANIANSIISTNKQIYKYINIGGKPQNLNIKTLQLLINQDENELEKANVDPSSIKIINMNNIGEISDFIFSRRYLESFNFFKDKSLMLQRFNLIINEINKFIEERGS